MDADWLNQVNEKGQDVWKSKCVQFSPSTKMAQIKINDRCENDKWSHTTGMRLCTQDVAEMKISIFFPSYDELIKEESIN